MVRTYKQKAVKNSRTQRVKKGKSPKAAASAQADTDAQSVAPIRPHRSVPNVWRLSIAASKQLWAYKRTLGGILLVYAVLNIIFVTGLGGSVDTSSIQNAGGKFVSGLATYTQLIGTATTNSSSASSVYQIVLFIIVSLALIWALRRLRNGDQIRVKEAFYQGMYPLIPFVLMLVIIALQLLPLAGGSALYQIVVSAGIAATAQEKVGWGIGALLLILISLFFVARSAVGLYIVTLPDMTPLAAFRSAKDVVRGRRWLIIRKALFAPLALFIVAGLILLPVIWVVPVVAPWLMLAIGPFAVVCLHTYFYNLYRELIDD